mgnify:CR=1 FL=1
MMKPILALITLLITGCGEEPKYCTEIGCSSGVNFEVLDSYGGPAVRASGTITIDGTDYGFDCENPDGSEVECYEGIVFISVESGTTATYSVTWADESAQGEIDLEFEESQPNGEGCEPICYNAQHTIELIRSFE